MRDGGGAATQQRPATGWRATVHRSNDALVATAEHELDAAGFPLPLPSRVAWAHALGDAGRYAALVHDADGLCRAAIGISLVRTWSLPGHTIGRVEAMGPAYAGDAGASLIQAIVAFAREHPRILRVVVDVSCRGSEGRAALRDQLRNAGFAPTSTTRLSARTLAVDLTPTEDAIFAAFSRSTRQNVRAAAKHDLQVDPIRDSRYGPRMNTLLADSLARTGALASAMDWKGITALCRALPDRSRVIGVFRGASREPADLVGYAWGLHHGDRVEYSTGASDRIPGVRLPILYPALWDLISWGHRTGGLWFDLGGVTPGSVGSADALGGISDFKRGFSRDEIDLGEEWVFTPRPLRSRIAAWTSSVAHRVRRLKPVRPPARPAATRVPGAETAAAACASESGA